MIASFLNNRLMFLVKIADIIYGECPCGTLTKANVPHTDNTRNFTIF